MRVVLQRVSRAEVKVAGEVTGRIGAGLLLLAGFHEKDRLEDLQWMARKCVELRVFRDDEGKTNLGLREVAGEILLVSQFTLYGDCQKGRRPTFLKSAPPERAEALYEEFLRLLREQGINVETGKFGARMAVDLLGDGPFTLVLQRGGEE
ncbi:MAG TPA: D-aminoacyl-tRNA deacylase [Candidatus Krumholzibacteria bacterium]|nr:D-aminoacyl-tRNA deacylase [Candidatus Krumholzibacteria bacterium]